jgi:hypothetical protein
MTEHPPVLRDPNKQVVMAVACAEEWHVNFADPRLVTAYGSGLFARDEMRVGEHLAHDGELLGRTSY